MRPHSPRADSNTMVLEPESLPNLFMEHYDKGFRDVHSSKKRSMSVSNAPTRNLLDFTTGRLKKPADSTLGLQRRKVQSY